MSAFPRLIALFVNHLVEASSPVALPVIGVLLFAILSATVFRLVKVVVNPVPSASVAA